MKVYIVKGCQSDFYGDNCVWMVTAYIDKDSAETLCFYLNDKVDQLSVLHPAEAGKEMQKIDSSYRQMSEYNFYACYSVEEVEVRDGV